MSRYDGVENILNFPNKQRTLKSIAYNVQLLATVKLLLVSYSVSTGVVGIDTTSGYRNIYCTLLLRVEQRYSFVAGLMHHDEDFSTYKTSLFRPTTRADAFHVKK